MTDAVVAVDDRPSAEPTKEFFVDMLTRDIPLEQAILDLVDNCVDGAKRLRSELGEPFSERLVEIELSADRFRIVDNCGGFDRETATTYAFRFGRPSGFPRTANSIGQFGVGMKRALFKFGRDFTVRSATPTENWAIAVNVDVWELGNDWHFPWADFGSAEPPSAGNPGTEIIVERLRPEVSNRFKSPNFVTAIFGLIKSKHRQFISEGLRVRVNGRHIDATNLNLLHQSDLKPGVDFLIFEEEDKPDLTAKIVVGLGGSNPKEAGWYIVCNGRVVLEADRGPTTGWGQAEEASGRLLMPSFHNQYARFRGVVWFECEDSSRVPWNTTKTDVDQDSPAWRLTFERMLEMSKPVMAFLNELDRDIDEYTRENSALLSYVNKSSAVRAEQLQTKTDFVSPKRESVFTGPKTTKIQYSKPVDEIEALMEALGLTSAKSVGEKTFEIVLARHS